MMKSVQIISQASIIVLSLYGLLMPHTNQSYARMYAHKKPNNAASTPYNFLAIKNKDIKRNEPEDLTEYAALRHFNVPYGYELITNDDADDAQSLRYGDIIKLWHPDSNSYLHTNFERFSHETSSGNISVMGLPRLTAQHEAEALWWKIVGPIGEDEASLEGQPVNYTVPIRLVLVNQESHPIQRKIALYSLSRKNHDYTSPVRETFEERKHIKQEISLHHRMDINSHWFIRPHQADGIIQQLRRYQPFSLEHAPSTHYLRAHHEITVPTRHQSECFELSGVNKRKDPFTTFVIPLIARKEEFFNASFTKTYINLLDEESPYSITADDLLERPCTLLINPQRNGLALGFFDKNGSIKYATHHQTTPSWIQYLRKTSPAWTPSVLPQPLREPIDPAACWIPCYAPNNSIYLKNKASGWFLYIKHRQLSADQQRRSRFILKSKDHE